MDIKEKVRSIGSVLFSKENIKRIIPSSPKEALDYLVIGFSNALIGLGLWAFINTTKANSIDLTFQLVALSFTLASFITVLSFNIELESRDKSFVVNAAQDFILAGIFIIMGSAWDQIVFLDDLGVYMVAVGYYSFGSGIMSMYGVAAGLNLIHDK